jgi:hypothetical protein
MIACAMASGGPSTPELGACATFGGNGPLGVCARAATGAHATAAMAIATAAIDSRQRRDTCNLLAAKLAAKAHAAGADRVTSEAAKPHLRRQRAKRQPPGRRTVAEG